MLTGSGNSNNGFMDIMLNRVELTNNFSLCSAAMEQVKELHSDLFEGRNRGQVDLRMPACCPAVEGEPELCDFGHVDVGFR